MNTRQEIAHRLQENIPDFQEVGGAADEERIQTSSVRPPACFVIQLKTDSDENTAINGVLQRLTEYYGIYIVVENIRDALAGDSMDNVNVLSQQVMETLLNWRPSSALMGMVYEGGELAHLNDNQLLWVETYSCYKHIQQLNRNL